jgi:hypothetical protein
MIISHSRKFRPTAPLPKIKSLVGTVSEAQLRESVEQISQPRHYTAEAKQNRATADWLVKIFDKGSAPHNRTFVEASVSPHRPSDRAWGPGK